MTAQWDVAVPLTMGLYVFPQRRQPMLLRQLISVSFQVMFIEAKKWLKCGGERLLIL